VTRPLLLGSVGIAVLIVGLAVVAGCGGDEAVAPAKKAAAPAGGFNSAYCVTARKWAAHELEGDGNEVFVRGGPAALEKYWGEWLAYLEDAARQAPPQIRNAMVMHERAIRTVLTPVLEKYGFDPSRIAAEGSAAEKALGEPTAEQAKAQDAIHAYDDKVCGYGGSPPAADVTFTASAAAKPYCEAVAAQRKDLDEIAASGFDPDAVRSYATSGRVIASLDKQEATAPPEIAADVKADSEWARTRQLEAWKKFDYDARRLLLEGSAADLAAWSYWDPAIREQGSRVTAYQEQICGL
jgi:hypothetical protein